MTTVWDGCSQKPNETVVYNYMFPSLAIIDNVEIKPFNTSVGYISFNNI